MQHTAISVTKGINQRDHSLSIECLDLLRNKMRIERAYIESET